MQTVVLNGLYFPFVDLLSSVALAVVLGYGGHLYFSGDAVARDAVRLHALREQLLRPGPAALAALQHVPLRRRRRWTRSSACSTRSRRSSTARRARRCRTSQGRVRFDDVRFAYGRGAEVLHGIDLDVPAGTTVALVGHTGAGKSTIAKLLARFYDPTDGRITIDGIDLRDVTQASLRRQLGIVPQEGFLFAGTVHDNIAFGRPGRDARARSSRRRRRSARTTSSSRLEDGYDTQLQERGSRLSLGQRQLVAFARALLADPRILILDEATSSVDIGTERKIEQALRTPARRPHRVRDRAPALDDPRRRPDRRARARPGRRAGLARRAAAPRRPLHVALRRLGRRRRRSTASSRSAAGASGGSRGRRSPTRAGSGRRASRDANRRNSCRPAAGSCVARSADQSASASMWRVTTFWSGSCSELQDDEREDHERDGRRHAHPAAPPGHEREQERDREGEERVPADRLPDVVVREVAELVCEHEAVASAA